MSSKPEKRVRIENSMGPRGFEQISVLKLVPKLADNNLGFKLYPFIIGNYFKMLLSLI